MEAEIAMTAPAVITVTVLTTGAAVALWLATRLTGRKQTPRVLEVSQIHLYRLSDDATGRHLGIVTGDLRRVRCAQVWVNPENTEMRMARINEFSISAIIRHEGARRDATGRVITDLIADELDQKVRSHRPVPAGTAIVTGAGQLGRFGVRYVVHSAAVHGEPGAGYRQVREVGRCASIVLTTVDGIADPEPVKSVLFPLLGTGQGGGQPAATATALVNAAADYFAATPNSSITTVFLLAYTNTELAACRTACESAGLKPIRDSQKALTLVPATEGVTRGVSPNADKEQSKTLHIGFSVDIVSYGRRLAADRDEVERRLVDLLRGVLADADIDLEQVRHEWLGDGASVYLPSDIDPSRTLPTLVDASFRRLTEDNRQHSDRIRLRMAMTVGLLGPGATGYSGPLPVDLARMTDATPLRQAMNDEPDRDLAVLLSDYLYAHVVQLGYSDLPAASFHRVEVSVKEFTAVAWLWLPDPLA